LRRVTPLCAPLQHKEHSGLGGGSATE